MKRGFRKATIFDSKRIFDWRNDPHTRRMSKNSEVLDYDHHQQWFYTVLYSDDVKIWIYEEDGVNVGLIRENIVDIEDTFVRLSWMVNPDYRGKGIGGRMLTSFVNSDLITKGIRYEADILSENEASIKIATKAGFVAYDKNDYIGKYKLQNVRLTDLEIIDAIQNVRSKNNVNWMDILRIAFKHAPEETREVFKRITDSDDQIGKLSRQLANNGKKS